MPRLNLYIILFAILVYALTAGVTLRDRLLIATLHRIERNAIVEPSAQDLFEGAMTGMTDVLSDEYDDWYSQYIPSSKQTEYQDDIDNRYEGIGTAITIFGKGEESKLFVYYPLYDSPAYRAGLRSGDQILYICGTPVKDKTLAEALLLLRQEKKVHLSVLPFGQTEPLDVAVSREKNQHDSVEGDYFNEDKRVFFLEAHPKIGYIRITSFGGTTAEEFGNALDTMMQSGVESFILDLRNNGGGDMWNCVQIAKMLLSPDSDNKVIVSTHPRSGHKRSFVLTQGLQRCTLPMAVLIDGETASASEILAAALQDHNRATIVGTRSFGKGVVQGIITLPFQSGMLQLTDSEYRRPSGAAIHRKRNAADSDVWGIIPDKVVEQSEAEHSAVLEYRRLCSNVISMERLTVLEQFRQCIIAEQEEPLEFAGTAPYYDLQLDEAIRILLGM